MMHRVRRMVLGVVLGVVASAACASGAAGPEVDPSVRAEQPAPQTRDEQIAVVHQTHRAEIGDCFEAAAAAAGPEAVYQAEVELHLPASGTPTTIRLLEADTLPPRLRLCLEEVFTDLEYGEAERGATFYQTLEYDPEAGRVELGEAIDAYHRWGLTGQEIEGVLFDQGDAVSQCYQLSAGPEGLRAGRVLVTLAIDREGMVSRAGVKSSTLDSPKAETCLIEAVFGLRFPKPRGGGVVVIDYPFVFDPDVGWVEEPAAPF